MEAYIVVFVKAYAIEFYEVYCATYEEGFGNASSRGFKAIYGRVEGTMALRIVGGIHQQWRGLSIFIGRFLYGHG